MESKILHEILQLVDKYYEMHHKPIIDKVFDPALDKVNYAGRVFNQDELKALVSCSLDFWLTHGEYGQKFEQKFAEYLGVKYAFLVNSGSSLRPG